ncbi:hypothetical protein [Microbacterium sp.]|uniref:hypothetical protein n=1 Tax=Microbacterium sp. TaxID=51671 RepID=UPI00261CD9F5|nr:hypothetical protein [Microbacterium sp.]
MTFNHSARGMSIATSTALCACLTACAPQITVTPAPDPSLEPQRAAALAQALSDLRSYAERSIATMESLTAETGATDTALCTVASLPDPSFLIDDDAATDITSATSPPLITYTCTAITDTTDSGSVFGIGYTGTLNPLTGDSYVTRNK